MIRKELDMKIQKKKKSKKVLIVALVIVFVLAGGAAYWCLDMNGFFGQKDPETQVDEEKNSEDAKETNVDDSIPTEDISDGEQKGGGEKPPVETDVTGKKVAQIVVVDASQYDDIVEVRAGVNNLAEDGGKCEFTFTKGNQTLTRTTKALFSGTDVNCETLNVPVREFPAKGEWSMVVKYTSNTAAGSSQSKTIVLK